MRRSSGSGDVFIPVIIILLGITILSLLIAFVWQKWQDKYDPDYLYPDSRPSSSQSESSSEASEPSSSEEKLVRAGVVGCTVRSAGARKRTGDQCLLQ